MSADPLQSLFAALAADPGLLSPASGANSVLHRLLNPPGAEKDENLTAMWNQWIPQLPAASKRQLLAQAWSALNSAEDQLLASADDQPGVPPEEHLRSQQALLEEWLRPNHPWLPMLPALPKTLPKPLRRRFRLWMGLPGNTVPPADLGLVQLEAWLLQDWPARSQPEAEWRERLKVWQNGGSKNGIGSHSKAGSTTGGGGGGSSKKSGGDAAGKRTAGKKGGSASVASASSAGSKNSTGWPEFGDDRTCIDFVTELVHLVAPLEPRRVLGWFVDDMRELAMIEEIRRRLQVQAWLRAGKRERAVELVQRRGPVQAALGTFLEFLQPPQEVADKAGGAASMRSLWCLQLYARAAENGLYHLVGGGAISRRLTPASGVGLGMVDWMTTVAQHTHNWLALAPRLMNNPAGGLAHFLAHAPSLTLAECRGNPMVMQLYMYGSVAALARLVLLYRYQPQTAAKLGLPSCEALMDRLLVQVAEPAWWKLMEQTPFAQEVGDMFLDILDSAFYRHVSPRALVWALRAADRAMASGHHQVYHNWMWGVGEWLGCEAIPLRRRAKACRPDLGFGTILAALMCQVNAMLPQMHLPMEALVFGMPLLRVYSMLVHVSIVSLRSRLFGDGKSKLVCAAGCVHEVPAWMKTEDDDEDDGEAQDAEDDNDNEGSGNSNKKKKNGGGDHDDCDHDHDGDAGCDSHAKAEPKPVREDDEHDPRSCRAIALDVFLRHDAISLLPQMVLRAAPHFRELQRRGGAALNPDVEDLDEDEHGPLRGMLMLYGTSVALVYMMGLGIDGPAMVEGLPWMEPAMLGLMRESAEEHRRALAQLRAWGVMDYYDSAAKQLDYIRQHGSYMPACAGRLGAPPRRTPSPGDLELLRTCVTPSEDQAKKFLHQAWNSCDRATHAALNALKPDFARKLPALLDHVCQKVVPERFRFGRLTEQARLGEDGRVLFTQAVSGNSGDSAANGHQRDESKDGSTGGAADDDGAFPSVSSQAGKKKNKNKKKANKRKNAKKQSSSAGAAEGGETDCDGADEEAELPDLVPVEEQDQA